MAGHHAPFESGTKSRAAAFAAVVLAHAVLIAGLAQLASPRPGVAHHDPLQVALIAEPAEQVPPPEPLKPRFEPPRVDLVPPDVIVEIPPETTRNALTLAIERKPAPAPDALGSEPVLVSEVQYVSPPRPTYPRAARKRRQEGLVMLKVVVDVAGRPAAVEVHESSGHPLLDSAACDAVKQTRFQPHVENGRARPMLVMVPIEFRLNDRVASSRAHGS